MANEIGNAEVLTSIPDIVQMKARIARYARAKLASWVQDESFDVATKGDRVSVQIMPTMVINDVGTDGSVTNQQVSVTESEVIVDQWREITVSIVDKAEKQSALKLRDEFLINFAGNMGEDEDNKLFDTATDAGGTPLSLLANVDTGTGAAGELSDTFILAAKGQLDDTKIPAEDRMWYLHPESERALLKLARFSEAQNTGFARGLQVTDGKISMLYGTPVRTTPLVPLSPNGNFENLLLHKGALAIARQKNFSTEFFARDGYRTPMSASILYGVKTVRPDHGVIVYSKTP